MTSPAEPRPSVPPDPEEEWEGMDWDERLKLARELADEERMRHRTEGRLP